ncbi:MAG TPA: sugar ABC transporter ATP-binding protein [Tepidisphaeraceae bacterium]|jgi:ribose transport system ATP-binding protein
MQSTLTQTLPQNQPPAPAAPLLAARNLSKSFPGVRALHDVSLTLSRGEVLAVIGENGAGKSTLVRILAGVQPPDRGQILLDGQLVTLDSVNAALAAGIVLIHQELNLAENLDVGANIFLGREPRRLGFTHKRRIDQESATVLRRVGLDVSPRTIVGNLSIGQQQMVEIAKALACDARVLIMDEPTSSLSRHETEQLFGVIRDLRARGISVIYISHRLGEVKELADRVVVLRDGKSAGELARHEIDHDRMVRLMVGRDLAQLTRHERPARATQMMLEAVALRTAAHPGHPLHFSVRAGEIVGVAGLVGAGRTEVLETLFGVVPAAGGQVRVAGNPIPLRGPADAIRAGLALVPEDRKLQGLVLGMAVCHNVSLACLDRATRARAFLDFAGERRIVADMIRQLDIRTPSDRQVVQYLSGGNQQKVVLAKWLAMRPKVLLLDEPTRGVDVGAKQEIYRLMEELAARGVAILFVSSEMEEVLRMSDRVLVMHEGQITGELSRDELNEESIMRLATGARP